VAGDGWGQSNGVIIILSYVPQWANFKFCNFENTNDKSIWTYRASTWYIQRIPQLPPHRKQSCTDSKTDFKMIKINFLVTHITELYKFSISSIPEAHLQILQKNTAKIITDIP
jgi:hypothetical protein